MSQKPTSKALAKRAPKEKLQVTYSPTYHPSRLVVSKSYTSPPKKAEFTPVPVKTSSPPTTNQPEVLPPTGGEIVRISACGEVAPVPVKPSSLPMTIQPKVPPPNGIEVVHVPADPLNGRKILFLPTIKVDGCDAPTGYTAEAEQKLKQVPNVRRYNETFDWKSRSLYEANINGTGVPDDYQGIYFVYKCTKARAGLQMNGGLEHMPRVRAYGDFFVFRLKNPGYSASGQADFGAFGAGFLKDYDNHGFAKCLLSSMAIVPNEEEKKKEEKEEKEKKKNMAKEKQESKEMEEKNEKGEKKEKKEKKEEEKKKQEKQEKKEKKENKQKKESSKK